MSKARLIRICSDYGMVFVLLLLCVLFSIATYSEQHPTGDAAAVQLAREAVRGSGKPVRVLIAVRDQAADLVFADRVAEELKKSGAEVVAQVRGEPRDARQTLAKLSEAGRPLDAIACNQATASWLVFADLRTDFPKLGTPRILQPTSYRWPNFLKSDNLLNIANQIAVIAILAIGMTMVVITGGIDLSVGSVVALSAVSAAWLIREVAGATAAGPLGMTLCCLGAVLLSGAVGGFSGAMVAFVRVPPFIVTLAMMLVASGAAYLLAQGQSIYQVPDSFVWLGRGADFFEIPNAVLLMLGLYGVAHVVMSQTVLGRRLYAVGGNRLAAIYSGVPVGRVVLVAYIVSGLLAGLGGVILASQLKSGAPSFGQMYELYVIAAVVVGGTSLSGGSGRMFGTLVGALTIAVIQNGMNLTNVESYTQKVVLGLVILVAVLLDQWRRKRLGGAGGEA